MLHKREVNPPYFYSYSAFRQLSNDPPKANAKRIVPLGRDHQKHHYDIGNHPEWTQPMVSTQQDHFITKPMAGLRYDFKPPGATESTLKMEMDGDRRLKSTVQADYTAHSLPPKAAELTKKGRNDSEIVMGDDPPIYKTTYSEQMRAFRVRPDLKPSAPIRYDIITNGIKKVQETAPFDYWNPAKAKLRISKNRTALPELKQTYNILNGWPVRERQLGGATSV